MEASNKGETMKFIMLAVLLFGSFAFAQQKESKPEDFIPVKLPLNACVPNFKEGTVVCFFHKEFAKEKLCPLLSKET